MLSRRGGVALWRQISARLEAEIRGGAPRPGERLPPEEDLARRFRVNRHTVRRGLADLEARGLVRAEQGRGTFVLDAVLDYPVTRRTRFRDNLRRQRRRAEGELVRAGVEAATPEVAAGLGLRPGARVSKVVTLGFADGRPVSFAAHWFPARRFPELASVFERTHSVTATLAHFGVGDYVRRRTRVHARLPDEEEVERLRVAPTRPVLVAESVNVDARGRPVEYGVTAFPADRVQLVFEP